ncbi:AI-2E family transporter [Georgenia wutianyii]|uniref:AI-2E family transporter n=1 Tax=Georgenia wutianyii TaxID=2585135 RepID=A0ABX5VR89_9MICO|nr:AI-2E family transporter [Georgenia wutianyii]QDB79973.1 AI-2E family transporter [Georgenia wutianyii]
MTAPPAVVWGRRVWLTIGVVILLVAACYAAGQVSLVVVPVALALFPAALLAPLTARLRATRLPDSAVALLILLLLLVVLGGAGVFIGRALAEQAPQIADHVSRGLSRIEDRVDVAGLPGGAGGIEDLARKAGSAVAGGGLLSRGLGAAEEAGAVAAGALILLVVLFFYVKDGRRLWVAVLDLVPARHQARVDQLGAQSFATIGFYLRGRLLVAAIDAVTIGVGLWILQVPLALPLSMLVLLGALLPFLGALLAGSVAAVVALADRGFAVAIAVVVLVVLVQEVEAHILTPVIQGRVVSLHPLLVLLSVTAGTVLLGILGAFLAVPVAAVLARLVDNLRGRPAPTRRSRRRRGPPAAATGPAEARSGG